MGIDWKSTRPIEAAVALLGLLWLTGVFQSSLPRHLAHDHAWIGWGIELLQCGLWVAPIALLLWDPRHLMPAARCVWPALLIVVLAAISTFWSIRPEVTIRGSALLAATSVFGIFFGLRFAHRNQLTLIGVALGLVAIGSVITALAFPDHGIMQERTLRGMWMGLYRHKNLLARDMALAVPVLVMLARGRIARPILAWSFVVICVFLIGASGSRTGSLVVVVVTAAALILTRDSNTNRVRWRVWICAGAVLCVAIAMTASTLLEWVDRDVTLTGRTQLWAAVTEKIGDRPWFGYGYDAFWLTNVTAGEPAAEIAEKVSWVARHAHNGFLDIALDLGAIGLLLFLVPLVAYATRIARDVGGGVRSTAEAWPAVFMIYWLLSNLTESPLVRHDHLGWALYLAVIVSTAGITSRAIWTTR